MYTDHFRLTSKPFQITSNPAFLWLGEKHKEALATLRYGIHDNRGFLLLTGEVGTGKTILVNKLISLVADDIIVATLPDPDLDAMDFYKLLANSLEMDLSFNTKAEFLIQFRDFLHQCYTHQKQVLLIIDESQRLNSQLMEEIRVLSNIELQDHKLINIFFVGQPEFNDMLMTPENRALSQRITVRYNIEVLDQQETRDYVNHRLGVAGCKDPIFKASALDEVFHFSGGIPRLINIVCDHALLTAFSKNLKEVDARIIRECAEELRIPVAAVQSSAATFRTQEETHTESNASHQTRPRTAEPGKRKVSDAPVKGWSAITMPSMSGGWKLLYYGGILLLLLALVVALTFHAGAPERSVDDRVVPPKEDSTRRGTQEEPPPGPPSPAVPMKGESRPVGAGKAPANAANVYAGVDKKPAAAAQRSAATGPMADTIAPNAASARMKSETLPVTEAAVSEESSIGPLPLLKEKVVIRFNFSSNAIDNEAYPVLDRIAQYIQAHPGQRIILKGYTDSSGSSGFNETVSEFRANAVKSYLIAKGVNVESITVQGLGAFNPIASNETVAGRRKNRRVEIEFVKIQ